MNGEVAQLVALVAHGNRYLVEGGEPPELFPRNSTFRWVGEVAFPDGHRGTASWYESLRAGGAPRLRLVLLPGDPAVAGFAGGTAGAIEADGPRPAAWKAEWAVRDPHAVDQRIWGVRYVEAHARQRGPDASVAEATARLEEALAGADEIARRDELLAGFSPWFAKARAMLSSSRPTVEHHPDLVPADGNLEARRLIAAAAAAWVFGGMGSWNDVGFGDERLTQAYQAATARLYEAVCTAIASGANAAGAPG